MTITSQETARPEYSTRQKAGFVLATIVALLNIPGAFIPTSGSDTTAPTGPPVAVLVIALVLGLVVVGLLLWAWRTGRRGPLRAAAVLLVVLALSALPAFFVASIAAWIRLFAGLYVLATLAAIVLLFSPGPRRLP
jgi:peptidoglycan/LPS O-acetylase OafA/YrhL